MSKTAELSGLELRQALCEALGWKLEFWHDAGPLTGKPRYWHSPACGPLPVNMGDRCVFECHLTAGESAANVLPAFESDPGVFWPEFEKWRCSFEVNKPGFALIDECGNDREPYYQFTVEMSLDDWRTFRATSVTSPTEAGCRAWLQALQAVTP